MVNQSILLQDGEDEMERQARLMQERMKNGPTPKKQKVKQGQQKEVFDSADHQMQKFAQQQK
ncbi:hypothetical protein pb186bvf_002591 [Paramecium bursaria]